MRFALVLAALVLTAAPAFANSKNPVIPDVPAPLQPLAEKGAQLRFLGNENGMDGWIAIYQGQEQYYYITPDKKAFVTGLMFADDGRPITVEQVRDLQRQSGGVLDLMAEDVPPTEAETAATEAPKSVSDALAKNTSKSPGERLFTDIEASNWLRLGKEGAPVIYSFIDPKCPHCHEFLTDLRKDYIDTGLIQVRIIPVGFLEGSLQQAAFLLASPDAEQRFYRHLDGDKDALPVKSDISTQAIQKNMALMQAWKFNVTPLTAYRSRTGEIKIVRGRAKDVQAVIADLPSAAAPATAR